MVNTVNMKNIPLEKVGEQVSEVIRKTGLKPKYIVIDEIQHGELIKKEGLVKVKAKRVVKWKGMSVLVSN